MRILIVDDELSMREYLEVLLARDGHQTVTAASLGEAQRALDAGAIDLVITDMKLGQESGMSVLEAARSRVAPPEVIVITAYGTPASAVDAMRAGAYDYVCKPFDNEELRVLVQKALEKRELLHENKQLKRSLASARGSFWIGETPAMRQVATVIEKVAASRSTVLIHGESGTGKELVARAIHLEGTRAGRPFVPVNCAALAEGVLESELFGHARGAFTGATTDRTGILVAAGEGTVFLDEIGEVPPAVQVKLLRVLQERKVKPVGSATELPFQARIVAATNRNLEKEVRAGRFREDLFYRLNVITLELPPLRERAGDIRTLANLFLERQRSELGRPNLSFSEDALRVLERYPFPGNIRQLENIVERASTLADADEIGTELLPAPLRGEAIAPSPQPEGGGLSVGFSLERHLDEEERRWLLEGLRAAGGTKTRAAQLLGLSFRSFRYRLAKHGLSDPGDESSS